MLERALKLKPEAMDSLVKTVRASLDAEMSRLEAVGEESSPKSIELLNDLKALAQLKMATTPHDPSVNYAQSLYDYALKLPGTVVTPGQRKARPTDPEPK